MSTKKSGRLVILCGPSGVGKTPLERALKKFNPDLNKSLQRLVVYNNRMPRPGETEGIDYHFRTDETLESMRKDAGFIVTNIRGCLQSADIRRLHKDLAKGDVLFEGNTLMARALQLHEHLEKYQRISVFLSPLNRDEIEFFIHPEHNMDFKKIVTEIIRRKLLRRSKKQKINLSLDELNNIELRAREAYDELKLASHFNWIIPNHDGEDSENWDGLYYPIGDARKAVEDFINLLENKETKLAEVWPANLVP